MILLYFLLAFLSTLLGSIAGIGGGFIIAPTLVFIGTFHISTIGVLSSATVLAMSIVSTIKDLSYKAKFNLRATTLLILGSILGGLIGTHIFKTIIKIFNDGSLVATIQAIILILLFIFVYFYMNNENKFKTYTVTNFIICILIGLALGMLSAFLGIGGGPLNIAVLTIFFSMKPKEAARNSILMIVFSQVSKLILIALTTGFHPYNLSVLPYMIIAGVLGGFIGSNFSKNISSSKMLKLFNISLISIILLNFYNIFKIILLQ